MDYTQFIKPFLLALLMLFSMLFLGFNWGPSIMFAFIPFALGSLNIMTRVAYSMTALALICAALSTVLKREDLDGIKTYIRGFVETDKTDKAPTDKAPTDKAPTDKVPTDKVPTDKTQTDKTQTDKVETDKVETDKAQ